MAETGRFISEDPWKGTIIDPKTLNPYPYVQNNPLKYIDPTGMVIKMGPGGEGPSRVTTKTSSPNIVNEVRKEVVKKEVNNTSEWNCRIVSDGRASEILNMFMDYVLGTAIGIDNSMFFGGTQLILGDREYPNTTYFRAGKVVGDAISIYIGGTLVAVGSVGEVGGLALDATGVGAILGVPLSIASAAAAAYGSVVVVNGTVNFYIDFKNLIDFSKSGNVSPPNGGSKGNSMFGENGTQVTSKTVWKEKGSQARIDVENPNPGQRPGQIHYQDANGKKYLFDPQKQVFVDKNGNVAPKSVNANLNNPDFVKKLNVGLEQYLGETGIKLP